MDVCEELRPQRVAGARRARRAVRRGVELVADRAQVDALAVDLVRVKVRVKQAVQRRVVELVQHGQRGHVAEQERDEPVAREARPEPDRAVGVGQVLRVLALVRERAALELRIRRDDVVRPPDAQQLQLQRAVAPPRVVHRRLHRHVRQRREHLRLVRRPVADVDCMLPGEDFADEARDRLVRRRVQRSSCVRPGQVRPHVQSLRHLLVREMLHQLRLLRLYARRLERGERCENVCSCGHRFGLALWNPSSGSRRRGFLHILCRRRRWSSRSVSSRSLLSERCRCVFLPRRLGPGRRIGGVLRGLGSLGLRPAGLGERRSRGDWRWRPEELPERVGRGAGPSKLPQHVSAQPTVRRGSLWVAVGRVV